MASAGVQPVAVAVSGGRKVDAVELLVKNGITDIPEMYVRPPHERPRIPTSPPSDEVPVIDLEGLNAEGVERETALKELGDACEEWGFFQIVNHGIPVSLMESMMNVSKEFFALPVEDKESYAGLPGVILQQGYGSKYASRDDVTRDWRDFLFLHLQPHSRRSYAYWPSRPSSFRETVDKYSEETTKVAQRLLGAFCVNLGLPERYLEEALGEAHQNMLINYYPPCPQPHLTAGFHAHSDLGGVTLLLQEPGSTALHVRKADRWIPVEALPGALLVNVGDQTEILTNGRYKSVEHRVAVDKQKPRISIPVFYDAAQNAVIEPAGPLVTSTRAADDRAETDNIRKYKSVAFKDHEFDFYINGPDGKKYVQSYILHP